MAAEITCPMCGKSNPAERDTCQYCEARLKPLTDELSRSQPPIRPGEEPQEVDTGQLESVLPKWLRDIRQQSRESAGEEEQQPPAEKETPRQNAEENLLAGLGSKAEDEEEIPSWLAGLRGEGGNVTFEETSTDEDDMAALRNMLGDQTQASADEEESPLPDWMSGLDAGEAEQVETERWSENREEPAQPDQTTSDSDSDFRWEADFGSESAPQKDSTEADQPFDAELPAWLQDSNEPQIESSDTGLPAWLSGDEPPTEEDAGEPLEVGGELPTWLQDKDEASPLETTDTGLPAWMQEDTTAASPQGQAPEQSDAGDLPAWLASLGDEESDLDIPSQPVEDQAAKSTTDWLSSLDEETASPSPSQSESDIKSTTDWLASLDEESDEIPAQQESSPPASEGEVPDWLATLGEESAQELPQHGVQPTDEDGTPAWLSSLGEEAETTEEEIISAGSEFAERSQSPEGVEIPDWLAAMGESTESGEELEPAAMDFEEQAEETGVPSTFVDDEGEPISTEDVDAIFSMGMPDWLSDTQVESEAGSAPASEEELEDELRPAELPSWVQAMRPVESVITETQEISYEDQPVEERGPLAGLRGVLPAVEGIGPSSKPKAYSIKLQASEDQQASAALLEKMLSEEINPEPVIVQKAVASQRVLRWIIAVLLLLVVGAGVYISPSINPIPTSVPPETKAVLDYITSTLPADSPVLLVFDYEAARAGEMEAAAAPVIDQMITLKSPRIGLIASNPTGSGLAERFMDILLVDRQLARNENFVNLGYLPGGAAGVQAFAGDPVTTKQFTTSGEAAWPTPVLQGVNGLSNFAAILLLTDDVETARIWIEQTEGHRGDAPLMVISSAQSGPMVRPYVRSGQVLGMISGLDSSAPIEQANSGRPGMARRYWDAYGFGLLAAVVMIAIGSLWGLISGLQANRKERGKK